MFCRSTPTLAISSLGLIIESLSATVTAIPRADSFGTRCLPQNLACVAMPALRTVAPSTTQSARKRNPGQLRSLNPSAKRFASTLSESTSRQIINDAAQTDRGIIVTFDPASISSRRFVRLTAGRRRRWRSGSSASRKRSRRIALPSAAAPASFDPTSNRPRQNYVARQWSTAKGEFPNIPVYRPFSARSCRKENSVAGNHKARGSCGVFQRNGTLENM